MDSPEEIRQKISLAANMRFRQYGVKKTTMSEIAQDCNMSTANIYRFYKSKNEIVTEMVSNCLRDKENSLREILRLTELSATERLELYMLTILQNNYTRAHEFPRIKEGVERICSERDDLVLRHTYVKQSQLARILIEGNNNGEFEVDNVTAVAETILHATAIVEDNTFIMAHPLEELKEFMCGIVRLLVNGLKK